MDLPQRKHLKHPDRLIVDTHSPIFFITITTYDRQKTLSDPDIASEIIESLGECVDRHGWVVGHYVIMPDHIHFFAAPTRKAKQLSAFIRDFKKWTSNKATERGLNNRLWQNEFFDHLLRSGESYYEKWKYVNENPVRAGLCETPDDWPYRGELCRLVYQE
jgi:REP element-mobilizing transposase RayT